MFISRDILPSLSETKIYQVNGLSVVLHANQDIFGFEVTMDVSHLMEGFNTRYQLICDQNHGLERELPATIDKEVFKRRPKELYSHNVVITFLAEPNKLGEANFSNEVFEQLGLFN